MWTARRHNLFTDALGNEKSTDPCTKVLILLLTQVSQFLTASAAVQEFEQEGIIARDTQVGRTQVITILERKYK